jgi:SAM-dependent methyltransferase
MSVQERAESIPDHVFTGGPRKDFERLGRHQFVVLINEGLEPHSKVLDIGCGAMRVGYWLLHFLNPGCYFGIEPNKEMLQAGINYILPPGLMESSHPSFAHNDDFDFSVFGVRFDFVLARSIWTHASKPQIETMLDSFSESATPGARMLASYVPTRRFGASDYVGTKWVGRSHDSDASSMVAHSRNWVIKQCEKRGLMGQELDVPPVNGQTWIRIVTP